MTRRHYSKPPIRITREQFFRVTEVMRQPEMVTWLQTERPNYKEVARKIGEMMGFSISPETIREANALLNLWEPEQAERARNSNTSGAWNEIAKLKEENKRMQAELNHLKMLVHHLYIEWGVRPPPTVGNLVGNLGGNLGGNLSGSGGSPETPNKSTPDSERKG